MSATALGPILRAAPLAGEATCLYFVQDSSSRLVKIGVTREPKARIRHMRVDNPNDLKVLGLFRVAPFAEFDSHHMLRDLRVRGEWFRPEQALFDHIETLARVPEFAW